MSTTNVPNVRGLIPKGVRVTRTVHGRGNTAIPTPRASRAGPARSKPGFCGGGEGV
jgi:hypothetical protein